MERWQDELNQRFQPSFEILTHDNLESARTGNWFAEHNLAIARLDKLSRDVAVQARLKQTDWDLIVCDEAHKLSTTFFGGIKVPSGAIIVDLRPDKAGAQV